MHINMKYYIVSIGAIFISLGIGILVGYNLNYDQALSEQQASIINDLDSKFNKLKDTTPLVLNISKILKPIDGSIIVLVILKYSDTTTNEINPINKPLKNAILISFNTSLFTSFFDISSSDIARIVTARLCVPTLPPIPRIIDWKNTIAGTATIADSNTLITSDIIKPSTSNAHSHGILFLTDLKADSSNSSSLVKPASFA